MKKLILLIISISFGMGVYAQSKNFNYQAVIRDDKGAVVKSKAVKVQFTIDMGDTAKTPEYVEEHALTTDLFGLISTKIGTGTATLGQFDTLNWRGNARRLKVEIDLSGGGTYALLSEAILASVPYALHAQTVDNVDDADADPTNEIQMLSISNDTLFLSNGGFVKLAAGTVNLDNDSTNELIKSISLAGDTLVITEADSTFRINLGSFNQNNDLANLKSQRITDSLNVAAALAQDLDRDSTNEIQMLTMSNDTIFLSNGGFVKVAGAVQNNDNDSTNEIQMLSMSNDTIMLTNGGFIVLPATAANNDNDSTNEIQVLSISNDTIMLSNGGFAVLPALPAAAFSDSSSTNEIQMLSLSNDTIFLSNGGFVKLGTGSVNNDNDSTNEIQMLSISNDTIMLSNGGFAVLPTAPANNDNDSTNEIQVISISNDTIMLSNGGFAVLPAAPANNDNDSTNEIQVISISNDTIMLSNGGFVVLPAAAVNNDNDSTNELVSSLSFSNDSVIIADAGGQKRVDISSLNQSAAITALSNKHAVDSASFATAIGTNSNNITTLNGGAYKDSSATNELQALSISNDTIYLSNGGFVKLPTAAANNDNDSTNEIQSLSFSNDTIKLTNGGNVNLSGYNTWTKSGSDLNFTTGKVSVGGTGTTGTFNVSDVTGTGISVIAQGTGINTGIQSRALSSSTNNSAMYGLTGLAEGSAGNAASAGTGNHIGVRGISRGKGTLGTGVYGESIGSVTSTSRGVEGFSNGTLAKYNYGVSGTTTASRGSATSGNNSGVFGYANGNGNENYGINGVTDGTGTHNYGGGFASYGGGTGSKKNYGVYSYVGFADTNVAFYADANNSSSKLNYGIYSEVSGSTSLSGRFVGNVRIEGDLTITGNISKGGGTFKIDHPVDPENKYLIHSFVESPDMMNVYNGNATTDASGIVEVTLPDYFQASNKDFRYQLTTIGQFAQVIVKEEISNNKFIIQTDKPNVKVSWQVTGIRNDPYSNDHRIVPVVDKPANEKGYYLHPESFGQDASKAIYKPMNSVDYKKSIEEAKNLKGSHSDAE